MRRAPQSEKQRFCSVEPGGMGGALARRRKVGGGEGSPDGGRMQLVQASLSLTFFVCEMGSPVPTSLASVSHCGQSRFTVAATCLGPREPVRTFSQSLCTSPSVRAATSSFRTPSLTPLGSHAALSLLKTRPGPPGTGHRDRELPTFTLKEPGVHLFCTLWGPCLLPHPSLTDPKGHHRARPKLGGFWNS